MAKKKNKKKKDGQQVMRGICVRLVGLFFLMLLSANVQSINPITAGGAGAAAAAPAAAPAPAAGRRGRGAPADCGRVRGLPGHQADRQVRGVLITCSSSSRLWPRWRWCRKGPWAGRRHDDTAIPLRAATPAAPEPPLLSPLPASAGITTAVRRAAPGLPLLRTTAAAAVVGPWRRRQVLRTGPCVASTAWPRARQEHGAHQPPRRPCPGPGPCSCSCGGGWPIILHEAVGDDGGPEATTPPARSVYGAAASTSASTSPSFLFPPESAHPQVFGGRRGRRGQEASGPATTSERERERRPYPQVLGPGCGGISISSSSGSGSPGGQEDAAALPPSWGPGRPGALPPLRPLARAPAPSTPIIQAGGPGCGCGCGCGCGR